MNTKAKIAAILMAGLAAFVLVAEEPPAPKKPLRKQTREEIQADLRRAKYRMTGGTVRKEGTARGVFAILNNQTRTPAGEFVKVTEFLGQHVPIQTKLVDVREVNLLNPKEDIARLGAAMGVVVVDDKRLPALINAPEDGWSIVNVAPLYANASSNEVATARVRKELMRAIAFVGGCSWMCRAPLVMHPTTAPEELDKIKLERYGAEAVNQMLNYLPAHGITPWHQVFYKKACQEGWAPAPTNDVQKAIWDKVHTIPSKPIKIEYNENRDKGK